METEVGPPNISIFEFLLNDHHAQIKSTLQDLFRRSTFLHHGNRSLLTLKSNIVQSKHDHYHYLDLNQPPDPKIQILPQKRAPLGEHFPTPAQQKWRSS